MLTDFKNKEVSQINRIDAFFMIFIAMAGGFKSHSIEKPCCQFFFLRSKKIGCGLSQLTQPVYVSTVPRSVIEKKNNSTNHLKLSTLIAGKIVRLHRKH